MTTDQRAGDVVTRLRYGVRVMRWHLSGMLTRANNGLPLLRKGEWRGF